MVAQNWRRDHIGTLAEIVASREDVQAVSQLVQLLYTLKYLSLVVVDEIGYLPIMHTGAILFFHLFSRCYETASNILTIINGIAEWGYIFGDEVIEAARINRLLHHCHIVPIRGNG